MKVSPTVKQSGQPSLVWDRLPARFKVEKSVAEYVEWTERNCPFASPFFETIIPGQEDRRGELHFPLQRSRVFFWEGRPCTGAFQGLNVSRHKVTAGAG